MKRTTASRVKKLEAQVKELYDLLSDLGVTPSKPKSYPGMCYHANENPFTCPCPKACSCKDTMCQGKVSW